MQTGTHHAKQLFLISFRAGLCTCLRGKLQPGQCGLPSLQSRKRLPTTILHARSVRPKRFAFLTSRCSLCGVERFSVTEKVFVQGGKLLPADVAVRASDVVNSTSQNIPGCEVPVKSCRCDLPFCVLSAPLFFFFFPSWCHSCTLGVPRQKAPSSPLIHGALEGPWLSLVTLPWWETPHISTSTVPLLPSTPKIDWWAQPSTLYSPYSFLSLPTFMCTYFSNPI